MNNIQFGCPEQAIMYLTECTLVTVLMLALKKRRSQSEFNRQIAIAQSGINALKQFNVSFHRNAPYGRVEDVVLDFNSSVKDWVLNKMEGWPSW